MFIHYWKRNHKFNSYVYSLLIFKKSYMDTGIWIFNPADDTNKIEIDQMERSWAFKNLGVIK